MSRRTPALTLEAQGQMRFTPRAEGDRRAMKAGLVLGAGGVLGGAWLTGALHALARETEWDPGSADYVVGTSAGAMIGSLLAAGVPPWFMVAHSRGESFEGLTGPDGRPAAEADRAAGAVFRLHRGLPGIGPGSLRMAVHGAVEPAPPHAAAAAGRLAAGRARLDRAAQGGRGPRGARPLGRAPELLGGGLRLPERPARPVRPRGRSARPGRRRGRRVLRDPRLLPPGRDRRAPLRGRRRLLRLEPRPPGGARARPGDLPEPAVRRAEARRPTRATGSAPSAAARTAAGSPTRRARCAASGPRS